MQLNSDVYAPNWKISGKNIGYSHKFRVVPLTALISGSECGLYEYKIITKICSYNAMKILQIEVFFYQPSIF